MRGKKLDAIVLVLFMVCTRLYPDEIFGLFINKEPGLIASIEIIDEYICKINAMGMPITSLYNKVGNHIILTDSNGSLIFTIKDENTLLGQGYCAGIYTKESSRFISNSKDLNGIWSGVLEDQNIELELLENKFKMQNDEILVEGEFNIKNNRIEFITDNDRIQFYFKISLGKILYLDSLNDIESEKVYLDSLDGIFILNIKY